MIPFIWHSGKKQTLGIETRPIVPRDEKGKRGWVLIINELKGTIWHNGNVLYLETASKVVAFLYTKKNEFHSMKIIPQCKYEEGKNEPWKPSVIYELNWILRKSDKWINKTFKKPKAIKDTIDGGKHALYIYLYCFIKVLVTIFSWQRGRQFTESKSFGVRRERYEPINLFS